MFPAMARATVGNVTATLRSRLERRGVERRAARGGANTPPTPPQSLDSKNRGFYTRPNLVKEVRA